MWSLTTSERMDHKRFAYLSGHCRQEWTPGTKTSRRESNWVSWCNIALLVGYPDSRGVQKLYYLSRRNVGGNVWRLSIITRVQTSAGDGCSKRPHQRWISSIIRLCLWRCSWPRRIAETALREAWFSGHIWRCWASRSTGVSQPELIACQGNV